MARLFLLLGSITGFAGVAAGAFGAHVLRDRLGAREMEVFETAVRYQLVHALALCIAAWACTRSAGPFAPAAGWFYLAGTVLFCGSLYALALGGPRWLGPVTPLGGLAFLAGWISLAVAAWRLR